MKDKIPLYLLVVLLIVVLWSNMTINNRIADLEYGLKANNSGRYQLIQGKFRMLATDKDGSDFVIDQKDLIMVDTKTGNTWYIFASFDSRSDSPSEHTWRKFATKIW